MSKDMSNIYFAAIEMDRCNQPVFIAANIENNPVIQFVSRGKSR